MIFLTRKNKLSDLIINDFLNFSKVYLEKINFSFSKIKEENLDIIEKINFLLILKEKLDNLKKLIVSFKIQNSEKEIFKIKNQIDENIILIINNWSDIINSQIEENQKNFSIFSNLRFKFQIGHIIILKIFKNGSQFYKEGNFIFNFLKDFKNFKSSENLEKIKKIFKESEKNYFLYIKTQKIFATYNSFCSRVYSSYFLEFVQNKNYLFFIKNINKNIINSSEINFKTNSDFSIFVENLNKSIFELNKEINNLIEIQKLHIYTFQILENLNFFENSQIWKNNILKIYQTNKNNINKFITKELGKLIIKNIGKEFDNLIKENFEKGIFIDLRLEEKNIISEKKIEFITNEFLFEIQKKKQILSDFNLSYLKKKKKKY